MSAKFRRSTFPTNIQDCGYLYIVFGENYIREALFSIESLRKYTSTPVTIFCDQSIPQHMVAENVTIKLVKPHHKRAKIDYIDKSPYRKTLYLDSDTLINSNIDEIFLLLEQFDVVGVLDVARKRPTISEVFRDYDAIPNGFGEINGGILGYNQECSAVTKLFDLWRYYFYKSASLYGGWDQPSLRVALWNSRVRMCILPPEYNVRSNELAEKVANMKHRFGKDFMSPRIYHMHYSSDVNNGRFEIENLNDLEKIVKNNAMDINF